jgi:predicted AlkP superfamily pyrophosphatase or phosphodiesterase
VIPCTDDPDMRSVSYGKPSNGHFGPRLLLVPTFGDQVRAAGGHVVTLALKARSAIMLAGHGGDAVTWMSDSLDSWETSTAYAAAPVPQVQAFLAANPIQADFGKSWTKLLPASHYHDPDDGVGEAPIQGWTTTFPHVLQGHSDGKIDTAFYDQWQHSPFANAYVARMAGALVESMQLGKHDATDYLGVSFSSTDLVGHSYGPHSQETQDTYARLDHDIGGLLDDLDRIVGRGRYVVALTGDHGVTDIPEQLKQAGKDGGRISASGILNAAQSAAEAVLGPGKYFARLNANDIYMAPGMYDAVRSNARAMKAIVDAIAAQPGIRRAYSADEIAGGLHADDPELKAAALSYVPGRSGDFVLNAKPGWILNSAGTTHGSASIDDRRVPVILFGAGIKHGRFATDATPGDIVPTLASMAGVAVPTAEGHPLNEALR